MKEGYIMEKATLNIIIASYLDAKAAEAKAKKEKERLAGLLKEALKNGSVETEMFYVNLERTESTILDTQKLYKDFPEMKTVYGKPSVKESIKIFEKSAEKTA
jgi:hypothetical protein